MINALISYTKTSSLTKTLVGVILLFACAQLSIPLNPVPISMQTVGLMIIALLYDRADAMKSVISYVTFGAMGLPFFIGYAGGINLIVGPRGGYIIGFIAATYVMSRIKEHIGIKTWHSIFINCLVGTVVIYFFGVTWLATSIGLKKAIIVGLLPFIIPGIGKAVFLTGFLRSLGFLRKRKL